MYRKLQIIKIIRNDKLLDYIISGHLNSIDFKVRMV